jgi:hypothetical protein|tara:strand:- start:264 stop:1124 length:861 start_codon:yes stop_codon:yes gene_type:complete
MEVIWVLENVLKEQKFYNQNRILLLISSVSLWRKYHPNHKTVLYCDNITYKWLNNLEILHLWDVVKDLSYPEKIDRKVFWSSCKTKIISTTKVPLVVVDHDFLIYKNIDNILNLNQVIYSYDELTEGWYPNKNEKFNKLLTNPIPRNINLASNVSLLYFPNPNFANKYGLQTLKNHEEFTNMGIKDTNYMIFSEQLMLKQWLERDKIPHKTLVNSIFNNKIIDFEEKINNRGIWNTQESLLSYKHYGMLEKNIDEKERQYLYRCINAGKRIDINKLKVKINESNPC